MQVRDMKQKSANPHNFAMTPKAEIPRSSFPISANLKTAINFSQLVPIMVEEVLPGDLWKVMAHVVARTPPLITPVMDNWHIETFWFFVPCRLLWTNWVKFMGEQDNPGDSISFVIPQVTGPIGGYAVSSMGDYMGLPTEGFYTPSTALLHNALPFRAYNQIYNAWFRDENLQNSIPKHVGDGPDANEDYPLRRRGKRHDYFTSALPFVQKGASVSIPLGSSVPVIANTLQPEPHFTPVGDTAFRIMRGTSGSANVTWTVNPLATGNVNWTPGLVIGGPTAGQPHTGLIADLSTATAATINQLRQSFQIQKLLERDARGGSRYTEIVRSHFGVISPDARLQRPEYLGGGHVPILTNAIPQTSATGVTGSTTPAGTLTAIAHAQGANGFTYSSTEHGYILGLINGRTDLTYQQGVRKLWHRSTRYDFYFPVFAMLGEQPVYNKEIYCDGSGNDNLVFGYQERWAEYRYNPSRITGIFRSTAASTLDYWHSAQEFATLPALNSTFISDDSNTVVQRNFSLGAASNFQQILLDILFTGNVARCMPTYSVPGMIDHF